MKLGDKIKALRKHMGLTQTELGEKLGVKTNAVSKWECGRVEDIPLSKIKAMAALFHVPPSFLIDEDITTPQNELDQELLILTSQLSPDQKRRQIGVVKDILGKQDT